MAMVVDEKIDKIDLNRLQKSFHIKKERVKRLKAIEEAGGIGNVINSYIVIYNNKKVICTMTDNGVLVFSGIKTPTIITMYSEKANRINRIFYDNNMPIELYNQIKNFRKAIEKIGGYKVC